MFVLAGAMATAEQPWMAYADASEAGFSTAALEEARVFADSNRAAAVMALYRGRVVAAWGAVDRPLMAHSVRKSLAGALYGIAVDEKVLSLSDTLSELGIDDEPALNAEEKRATFRDLIASRSGVYHGAAYADADQEKQRPARGSHPPGTFWFYNNWDFNTAESVYQQKAGEDIYAAFHRRIGRVIGMEDFEPARQLRVLEPSRSRFPAHTFRISTRDLARFGQLYLQEGRWGSQQVVPAAWVRESFRVHSMTGEKTGYGYLWWIYEAGSLGANYPTLDKMAVYLARGTGGQTVFVIPQAEMVVVHRGDTDNGRSVAGPSIWQLVERLVAARQGVAVAAPRLMPMVVQPLASNLPAPSEPVVIPTDSATRRRFSGEYVVAPGAVARVFEYNDRLFMSIPGQGEAELFATAPSIFTLKVERGVTVVFQSGGDGVVTGVEVTIGRQKIVAVRKS
ncbi:MAG: serine hydrolase [Acidobacteria bacterium]|nr:serine hydrolase [Acidobacteriota bacterium]